jgi:S1-C subfamily serine protease
MRSHTIFDWLKPLPVLACAAFVSTSAAAAGANSPVDDLVSAVVHISTHIDPDAQTAKVLSREREGSGIVIDDNGLILTIGYLMVEAYAAEVETNAGRTVPAEVVGYDPESGFGLLRATSPLNLKPVALGKSAPLKSGDPVIIAAAGGAEMAAPVRVVARREFAGSWEYLLDDAIFTAPPYPAWSGAALFDAEGKLVGVGSLIVGDARGSGERSPGNMFVPIDRLTPILASLVKSGRAPGPAHPWLGMTTDEVAGHLVISRLSPGGPADKAGLKEGDVVFGVGDETTGSLADFYRKVWARGNAGAVIPLVVMADSGVRHVELHSIDRLDNLKLKSTF